MRTIATVWSHLRGADWDLAVLVATFVLVAPLGVLFGARTPSLIELAEPPADDRATYEEAIHAAAVKAAGEHVALRTIDAAASAVRVVNYGRHAASGAIGRDLWVALPDQLAKACAGAAHPAGRLLEILGLPPERAGSHDPRRVFTLDVPREKLSRPCVLGGDLATSACSAAAVSASSAAPDPRYLAQQWNSYRTGFADDGYPFTGMGWSYDWGKAGTHVGVSEFVVAAGAEVVPVAEQAPEEFCGTASAAKP